jgi:uncharacterized membrane protein
VILAMVASVEAFFLSTFVLITQNRMAAAADKRADLDLQISLLAEHELTKVATLLSDMAKQAGVKTATSSAILPRLAAAQTSILAPRAMRGAASSGFTCP